jgi:hypothetical protein
VLFVARHTARAEGHLFGAALCGGTGTDVDLRCDELLAALSTITSAGPVGVDRPATA